MKKVAILQSNYIPWKGYFDMIAAVDEFIIYDEVQFTKNDWRNRNKIKTPAGVQWISIPVRQERLEQKISETRVSDRRWADKHWKTLKQNYARAEGFPVFATVLEEAYGKAAELDNLSDINRLFINTVNSLAGITTRISLCSEYDIQGDRMERLLYLCQQAGADVYLSGPAAKSYLDEGLFFESGIKVEWMDYSGYGEYPQLFPPFEHGVSIVDLMLNTGTAFTTHMKFAP